MQRQIFFINRFFYPDYSATSQILTELAFDLAAKGEVVHIVTSRLRYDDPETIFSRQELKEGVQIHRLWTSRFGRQFLPGRAVDYFTFYLSAIPVLLRLIHKGDLVVAMTDPPLISLVAAVVTRLKGGKLVNWIQDLFPEIAQALGVRVMKGWLHQPFRWLRNRSLHAAGLNVVVGQGMAKKLIQEGIPPDRIRFIPNWADGTRIDAIAPPMNPLRQEWGLSDRFVVGYSGNMGRAHEFETLLEAAHLLRNQPEIWFLFIGGGAKLLFIANEVKRLGLDQVVFQPYQSKEQLAASLSAVDLHWISLQPVMEGLIVPSKFYGIAAVGRPILFVGDPQGEIAVLLERFGCGFTIVPNDGAQLARRISQLAGDAMLRQEMGQKARQMLVDHFDRRLAIEAWLKLIQDI